MNTFSKDHKILKLCQDLRDRNLPYRAVILSNQTLLQDNFKIPDFINKNFYSLDQQLEFRDNLIQTYNLLFKNNGLNDLWVDIPKIMIIDDPKKFFIEITDRDYKRIIDLFNVDQWIESFAGNKYLGIIYSRKDSIIQNNVYIATKKLLQEVYEIEIDEMAQKLAKVIKNLIF
ncbi:hypothetical protein ES703_121601 [subsurface metagenome]